MPQDGVARGVMTAVQAPSQASADGSLGEGRGAEAYFGASATGSAHLLTHRSPPLGGGGGGRHGRVTRYACPKPDPHTKTGTVLSPARLRWAGPGEDRRCSGCREWTSWCVGAHRVLLGGEVTRPYAATEDNTQQTTCNTQHTQQAQSTTHPHVTHSTQHTTRGTPHTIQET